MAKGIGQYLLLAGVAAIMVASQLLLKRGSESVAGMGLGSPAQVAAFILRILTTPVLLAGYALSGIGALVWLSALSRMNLSFAAPVFNGFFYLLLLAGTGLLLREPVTGWTWAGTALIVAGIAALAAGGR